MRHESVESARFLRYPAEGNDFSRFLYISRDAQLLHKNAYRPISFHRASRVR